HEGGNTSGDYIQTLDVTDVCTGWTEVQAVKNKAQVWVFEALKQIRQRLPFDLLGIDSDNGSEFINDQLYRYCLKEEITFTRARAYRKNDNCYVEQKNWSVVRRALGYLRHDTQQDLEIINQLYAYLRLYTNYFQPVMKLKEKTRIGSRVKKRYDKPKTPYQRVLESPCVEN
ncbi:MAG TPA: transposase, partial [Thermodesulfobacteriota bacterium]|nr:transposase [Thermodesulfobacteriota bacterium]